jgi:predicted GNAT family acetyltransferase
MSDRFTDNRDESRFELEVDGQLAFANYRRDAGVLTIPHVEAAMPLRGTGAAGRLMQQVMIAARAEGARIRPLCGYAVAWMRRHPENNDLLA